MNYDGALNDYHHHLCYGIEIGTTQFRFRTVHNHNICYISDVYMVLVIAIAFVLAVAIVTIGIVCLYR